MSYNITDNHIYINQDSCNHIRKLIGNNIDNNCKLHGEFIFGKPHEFIAAIKNKDKFYNLYYSEGNYSIKMIHPDQDLLYIYSIIKNENNAL